MIKKEEICGLSSDVLSMGLKHSNGCAAKANGAKVQVIVNQNDAIRSWGWFCDHQCPVTLEAGSTFTPEPNQNGICSNQHNMVDDGS